MNELHTLGISASSREALEAVDPRFLREGLLRAQQKTIGVCEEIRQTLKAGTNEDDARRLALNIFKDHGVEKHWHRPFIRFGSGTVLTFRDPAQPDATLKEGDPYYIDVGPVWPDPNAGLEYEGDYGDTYVLGQNPEASRCAEVARILFKSAQAFWRNQKATGPKIYAHLKEEARIHGYELLDAIDGHRISDFTHMKYSKERLAKVPFVPSEALWVLEVQIVDRARSFGAFYEDLL